MKKRLSLLLAAVMIVSLLPMSSFAAGKAEPDVVVQNATNENIAANKAVDVKLVLDFAKKAPIATHLAPQNVTVEIKGAKFAKWDHDGDGDGPGNTPYQFSTTPTWKLNGAVQAFGGGLTVNTTENRLFIKSTTAESFAGIADGQKASLELNLKLNTVGADAGDVTLVFTDNNSGTPLAAGEVTIGSPTVKIAVVKDADSSSLVATAKDAETAISFDGGSLSAVEVKSLNKLFDAAAGATHFTFEIDEDYAFTANTKVYADGVELGAAVDGKGTNVLTIAKGDIPAGTKYLIINPELGGMASSVTTGDVQAIARIVKVVGGKTTTLDSAKVKMGKVVDFNVKMTVVQKGKKEIPALWGGEEETVVVTLKGPKGSILNRAIEFEVDGAKVSAEPADYTPKKNAGANLSGKTEGAAGSTTFKNNEFSVPVAGTDVEEVKFEILVKTEGDKDGVATIVAKQRGWEAKADLVKVTPKFAVKTEVMPVKKGEARTVANVTITEAKAGLLDKGEYLLIGVPTRGQYTQFSKKDVKVEATNGLKLGEAKFVALNYGTAADPDNQNRFVTLQFEIKKSSNGEPSVITISDLGVSVDGSATDDVVKVQGRLAKKDDEAGAKVSTVDFVKVVKEYALESIKTVFTIGQTQYTKNGQAMSAASAPYIKNGKTMLPIRAIAESLGLNVQWNGATKTATFSDATKVAAVTIGAEKMFVNGTPVPLAAKAELVSGTTFVELRSLATAFGVQIDWDAAAKTATVSK